LSRATSADDSSRVVDMDVDALSGATSVDAFAAPLGGGAAASYSKNQSWLPTRFSFQRTT
ncbi:hypothetical protein, partial [Effusibacillus lacus]|uniref:hypothetical protein n=1 Tax=Effusibacillus lacus TaxID=1348429 RepID=UPI001C12A4B7